MEKCTCTHCGKQINYGDVRLKDVKVSIEAVGYGDYFEAEYLCIQCAEKLTDQVRRLMGEQK